MSPLWQRLVPGSALVLIVSGAAFVVVDASREPERQTIAHGYVAAVHAYQRHVRPHTEWIHCRYVPTCSEYSVLAVERFGFARGIALTWRRIRSCTLDVPDGTRDEPPME